MNAYSNTQHNTKSHYLQPHWSAPTNVKAYATTRHIDGFSYAPFAAFNLAQHVGDNPANVAKNRAKLRSDLQLPNEPIWLNQAHTTNVNVIAAANRVINRNGTNNLNLAAAAANTDTAASAIDAAANATADAACTCVPNQICIVLTADCLPILLCNKQGTFVAAIHAGWRGLAAGIIASTIAALMESTASTFSASSATSVLSAVCSTSSITNISHRLNPDDILVWLGPAIGPAAFEVGEDVYQACQMHPACHEVNVNNANSANNGNSAIDSTITDITNISDIANITEIFQPIQPIHPMSPTQKWRVNIYLLAKYYLQQCGIPANNIYGGEFCTYHDEGLFFSYRRDNGITGRMASLIWMSE